MRSIETGLSKSSIFLLLFNRGGRGKEHSVSYRFVREVSESKSPGGNPDKAIFLKFLTPVAHANIVSSFILRFGEKEEDDKKKKPRQE